jgi:histidine triad (HIT) family protein
MKDDNCIFCKLANGDIPTNKIYEDDDFTVIMDASPATKGHALILPKEHYKNLYEMPDDLLEKVMPLAKKLATHMTEVLHCDGFNIVQNNNEIAGQTVFHFHVHLIPRYEGGTEILGWDHQSFTDEEMAEIRDSLKM